MNLRKEGKITVIIPALNEENTIGTIVETLLKSDVVEEIVVINNGSVDKTKEIALHKGAAVYDCSTLGFGRALKLGFKKAKSSWVVKVDGDMTNPTTQWIKQLWKEVDGNTVLVKGWWNNAKDPMPVTNLVAKPLLRKLYPELENIRMPLSGIYLVNKDAFDFSNFKEDFSFDIELLIRSSRTEFSIKQTFLGEVYDSLKPVSNYVNMSFEIISFLVDEKSKDSLFIVLGHADDAEIWCGGTITKYLLSGAKVVIVVLSMDEERKNEVLKIKQRFRSVTLVLLNEVEFQVGFLPKTVQKLSKLIEDFRPRILITHHFDDPHPDHKKCFSLVSAVLLKINRINMPKRIVMCNSYFQSNIINSFKPDIYINISEEFEIKQTLISYYLSQDTDFWLNMCDKIDSLNGMKSGVSKAEAYQTLNFYNSPFAQEIF